MKRNLLYTATLALLVACVLPNISQAQEVQEVQEATKAEVFELLKTSMRPEFLNRIDDGRTAYLTSASFE